MNKFQVQIASVPDREFLVAEIWYSTSLIGEVNKEKGSLKIELYPFKKLAFDLADFLDVLERAKQKLAE